MRKKTNSAQASLEFLTTYGWAFIMLLIMMGALYYFGVLSPSKLLPDRCSFSSEFTCSDWQVQGPPTNRILVQLRNSVGEPVIIQSFIPRTETNVPLVCDPVEDSAGTPVLPGFTMTSGQLFDFYFTNCNIAATGLTTRSKEKVLFTLNYYFERSTPDYLHPVEGEIYTTVTI
jgi:hypothetical protein